MDISSTYIPIDRRRALVTGTELPERTEGAALFADISGFTPLTAALTRELGPRRGAEELTKHLNQVFDALILELHRYGGSVIGFSGDAITCWLDGDDGRRAVACGLAMQRAMVQFSRVQTYSGNIIVLAIKVAVAVGPIRRFLVGDPAFTVMDTIVGKTLEQMAAAEGLARPGEIVVDSTAAARLGAGLEIATWRRSSDGDDEGQGDRYAVVGALNIEVPETPWPELTDGALTDDQKQAWIQPPIYQRMRTGRGEFLAELRPVVPLFVRFSGIAYDEDPDAPRKLDTFLCQIEQILARYDASLMHLTIGDKGSYLQAAFGAPIAHEDDEVRAAAAALAIRQAAAHLAYLEEVQIGIAHGRMRTGSYGGTTRRTYGMMGDEVILGARLMSAARSGQILVSEGVRQRIADTFTLQPMVPIRVKGQDAPVALAQLIGTKEKVHLKRLEPSYALPMVGRRDAQAQINKRCDLTLQGKGQIIGITAEAGMGKSRLAAEVIVQAQDDGFVGYSGECQSYGTNTSYLVWQNVWRGFFGLNPTESLMEQVESISRQLTRIEPSLVPRLPLLGALLNLSIPDTELTRSFDPKLRKTSLESMLVDCLQARSKTGPILLVLEDCHWLDPLSHDLIEVIARAIINMPVLMLLIYRPPDLQRIQAPRVSELPYFTEVVLNNFTDEESNQLITLKLQQFFGDESTIPQGFVALVTDRAEGNPFYIEEIINYLQDIGVDPHDGKALAAVDLPTSIYSLILSRLDQLNDQQQITIRVASVIGRLFRAAMVWGVYPELGEPGLVRTDLDLLSNLELTPLDTPDPELAYLFKHIMTQEVAYESLPFATRSNLHEQIGHYIEATYADQIEQYLDLLAFHFDQSDNIEKKQEYLNRAARSAQSNYANSTAISYYSRLLPNYPANIQDSHTRGERGHILYQLGQIWSLVGDYEKAKDAYQQTLALVTNLEDRTLEAKCRIAIGELQRNQSAYDSATKWFNQALAISTNAGDQDGIAKAMVCIGSLDLYLGNFADAQHAYKESLAIRRALDDQHNTANVINNLAITAANQGDFSSAAEYFAESLAIRRQLGDKWGVANSLANLGQLAQIQEELHKAHLHLEDAITICREVGDKWLLGNALSNQANVLRGLKKYDLARNLYEESLLLNQSLGDRWMLAYLLEDIGGLLALQGEAQRPLQLAGAAAEVREQLGTPQTEQEQKVLDQTLRPAREQIGPDAAEEAWKRGRTIDLQQAIELILT